MGTARCDCGFADSRVSGHSLLRSLCLWVCIFEGRWAQLASPAVPVNLHIRGSMGTACTFEDLRVNVDSSLCL